MWVIIGKTDFKVHQQYLNRVQKMNRSLIGLKGDEVSHFWVNQLFKPCSSLKTLFSLIVQTTHLK